MYPKHAGWDQRQYILADIYDSILTVAYTVAATVPKSHPHKPKAYKRPSGGRGVKIGRDPIKVADFDTWWKERAHHGSKQ